MVLKRISDISWGWSFRAEVSGRPHGRNQGEHLANTQRESGPSEQKEHFWDHGTKTLAKLPRRTLIIFGGDFNGDSIPDDAAIGWKHPCERNLRGGEALESGHMVKGILGEDTMEYKAGPIISSAPPATNGFPILANIEGSSSCID